LVESVEVEQFLIANDGQINQFGPRAFRQQLRRHDVAVVLHLGEQDLGTGFEIAVALGGVGALVVVNEGVDDRTRGPVHRLVQRGKILSDFWQLIVMDWGLKYPQFEFGPLWHHRLVPRHHRLVPRWFKHEMTGGFGDSIEGQ